MEKYMTFSGVCAVGKLIWPVFDIGNVKCFLYRFLGTVEIVCPFIVVYIIYLLIMA